MSSAEDLQTKIQDLIKDSSVTVVDRVAQHFADIVIARRQQLIIVGFGNLKRAQATMESIKADHQIFDDDGKPLALGWTAAQKSKRDKARGLVDRITIALTQALNEADFKKLEEVNRQSSQDNRLSDL